MIIGAIVKIKHTNTFCRKPSQQEVPSICPPPHAHHAHVLGEGVLGEGVLVVYNAAPKQHNYTVYNLSIWTT